jgi:phosphate transport system protein
MLMQTLEQELQRLQNEVLALSSAVEKSIVESVDVLKRRDLTGIQRLITLDQRISKKRFAIEMDCLTLIVTQQPIDGDLRTITSILEIATELERMGDCVRDIARTPFMTVDGSLLSLLVDIHRMATKTQTMLHRAMEAFIQRDLALARAIPAEDDEVDAVYNQVYQELLTLMRKDSRTKGDSRALVNQARYLARIARGLEHIADLVTRVCEWVVFSITGEMLEAGERIPAPAEYPPDPNQVPKGNRGESLFALQEGLL